MCICHTCWGLRCSGIHKLWFSTCRFSCSDSVYPLTQPSKQLQGMQNVLQLILMKQWQWFPLYRQEWSHSNSNPSHLTFHTQHMSCLLELLFSFLLLTSEGTQFNYTANFAPHRHLYYLRQCTWFAHSYIRLSDLSPDPSCCTALSLEQSTEEECSNTRPGSSAMQVYLNKKGDPSQSLLKGRQNIALTPLEGRNSPGAAAQETFFFALGTSLSANNQIWSCRVGRNIVLPIKIYSHNKRPT